MSLKSAEKTGANEVTLKLSIDAETFAQANVKAYNKAKKNISVPGFRKGKATKALIERYYGEGVFYEDAFEIAFPDVYEAAVKEAELDVVGSPYDFDVESIGKEGVEFSCKAPTKPEIELGEYKGLKAEKETVTVTAQDVENELKKKQEDNARIVDVDDRAVENGDIANIHYEGFSDGVPFDGGKAEEYDLTIGSGQFIPGFEEQIIGHEVGDEFDINVTFPEDYSAKDLAGKPVIFKIKLNAIKVKELPELDDEFAKDCSEFETLEELKTDIEKTIREDRQKTADKNFESKLLDLITDSVQAEIPSCMIESTIDNMIRDMDYRLKMQGMDFKTYLKYLGMEESAVRETYKAQAEKEVKLMLALEKIAKLEGIVPTAEELEAEYQKFADAYAMKLEDIKAAVSEKTVSDQLINSKTVDFIVANAKAVKPRKPAAKKSTKKAAEKTDTAEEAAPETPETTDTAETAPEENSAE